MARDEHSDRIKDEVLARVTRREPTGASRCREKGCQAPASGWGAMDGFCPTHAEERRRSGKWHTPPIFPT